MIAPVTITPDPSRTDDIIRTLTLQAGFNTNTVILGTTLLGFAAGVVGVHTLLRKRALVSDAIAHATLPGIAGAFILATLLGTDARNLPTLLLGAVVSAALSVLALQALTRSRRMSEDAAIGTVLSVSFAIGIVALSYIQKNAPDGSAGLHALIFGQAAAMRPSDVAVMGAIAACVIAISLALKKELAIVGFNAPFARVTGWPVPLIDVLLMLTVILVCVAGLQAVGLLMVIALLIIPPVAARFWTDNLGVITLLAGALGAASGYTGACVSALAPRQPAGAVIVLCAGAVFALSMLAAPRRGVLASVARTARTRLRFACDHVLEAAAATPDKTLNRNDLLELARERGWRAPLRWIVLNHLAATGRVRRTEDGSVTLTPAGLARGERVSRNHRLWEQYLVDYADIAPSHIDWSADQVEHVLPEDVVERLERAIARTREGVTP